MAKREVGIGEAALKGAIAGAVGGLALIAAKAVVERHPRARSTRARDQWDLLAARLGERAGVRLRGRARTAAGVGVHVLVSATLGAAYGVAVSHGRMSTPLKGLVEAGLVYGAYLAERPAPPAQASRGRRPRGTPKGLLPVAAHDLFGAATARVFQALVKR